MRKESREVSYTFCYELQEIPFFCKDCVVFD